MLVLTPSVMLLGLVFGGCDTNVFVGAEDSDPAQLATRRMEKNDPDGAIGILESALESDPGNQQLTGLLGAAYAQKAGVDMLSFLEAMLTDDSSESSDGDSTTALLRVLPDPTADVLDNLDHAVDLLASIDASLRTAAETFQLSLYMTSGVYLRIKAFDDDGDFKISPEEIANLTLDEAIDLIGSIANAASIVAAASSGDGADNSKMSDQLDSVQTAIDTAEGGDERERLQNYLSTRNS